MSGNNKLGTVLLLSTKPSPYLGRRDTFLIGRRTVPLLLLLVLFSGFAWGSAAQKVREGNRLYKEGDYENALNRYSEAERQRPDSPEISFNMGDSFYRQKRYQEAMETHARSTSPPGGPRDLQAKAHYNIGDSLFRQGKLEEALEAYKKAIDLDSADVDTKYNIEFLQRKLQEQQKQQEDKKKNPQQESGQKQQKQPDQGKGDQQKNKEQESEGGSQQKKENPQESQEKEKQTPQNQERQEKKQGTEISKEDAERLLGALQSEEKKLPVALEKNERNTVEVPPEEDW